MKKSIRLTIDLDSRWFADLQRVVNKGIELLMKMPDEILRSSGGRGYHLIWWLNGELFSIKDIIELRKMIGDDEFRVMYDEVMKGKPFQVLFTKKNRRSLI